MKGRGLRGRLIMAGAVAALWLCALGIMLLWEARQVQERLYDNAAAGTQAAIQRTEAAAALESPSFNDFQLAMECQEDAEYLDYPAVTATVLRDDQGNLLCRSRNILIARMTSQEGEPLVVPMVFMQENSADAFEVLRSAGLSVGTSRSAQVQLTGYWQDGLFYLTDIVDRGIVYLGGLREQVPQGAELMTYDIRGYNQGTDFYGLSTKKRMKVYGDLTVSTAGYAAGWERTDALIARLGSVENGLNQQEPMYLKKGLGRTVLYTCTWVFGGEEVFGCSGPLQLCYGMEFRPMQIAMRNCLRSGSFVLLLIPFGAALLLLPLFYDSERQKALRPLRDELNRQQQVIEYAQNAEDSRRAMTSAIAHELKTPIAVLTSYAEALQENIDAKKQAHYLAVIRDEADKMDKMVLELLDLSRLEAGRYKLRREDFDLRELVQEILRPLEEQLREKDIRLSWQVGESRVNADRYRFGQVVENYLTNAIRHTPQGGAIILRIGMNHETFSVENQGSHIPQEQMQKVWETFWQGDAARNERGSGLGLAICRSIMSLHGGSCKAENTPIGVRFTTVLESEAPVFRSSFRGVESVTVPYPISQDHTTVENALRRLGLLEGAALDREIRAGNLKVGEQKVTSRGFRLYPGMVLSWREISVEIRLDEREKHYCMLYEKLRAGGIGDPARGLPPSGGTRI